MQTCGNPPDAVTDNAPSESVVKVLHVKMSTTDSPLEKMPAELGMVQVVELWAPPLVRRVRRGGLDTARAAVSDWSMNLSYKQRLTS